MFNFAEISNLIVLKSIKRSNIRLKYTVKHSHQTTVQLAQSKNPGVILCVTKNVALKNVIKYLKKIQNADVEYVGGGRGGFSLSGDSFGLEIAGLQGGSGICDANCRGGFIESKVAPIVAPIA